MFFGLLNFNSTILHSNLTFIPFEKWESIIDNFLDLKKIFWKKKKRRN